MFRASYSCVTLVAVLLISASASAVEVPVTNGDFEILDAAGKPAGWVYTGMADDFGSAVYPEDSDNRVGFLADGQLIYQDIEASQLQLQHRLTLAFDVVKKPQSGPATILVQLIYANEAGTLAYAGDQEDCEVEFEVYGGTFTRYSVSINVEDEAIVGYPLRVRFHATVQNVGKKIFIDNVTLSDTKPLTGDLNHDGVVNWDDLDILLANWGVCHWVPSVLCPQIEPIPEDLLPERP